ncbi:MAG: hypothetical protein Q9200_000086 [Gallowayella weberi]
MEAPQTSLARCGEDRGPLLLAVGWILLSLAILTVATRLYFRTNIRNSINWDDYFVTASLALIFLIQCRPLNAMWNPRVKGTCLSARTGYTAGYANYALDALTDLICAIIPISVIHRLQMNVRTKVALCILMSLGVLTAGFAIGKCVTLAEVFHADYSWKITNPGVLTIGEHYLGIIIASMPALKPLFSKVLDATGSGSSGSKRNFKKIRSPNADLRGRHSYATSGSSSSRPDTIYKTAESKHSNLSDASQDYQAAETTLPGYSRDSGNIDWAYMAGPEKEDGPEATHIDDASHTSSLPLVRMARQSARVPQ